MFYLNEIFFRVFYFFFSFCASFVILYFSQKYIFTVLFLKSSSFAFETSFVLNSPEELIKINFFLPLLFSVIAVCPLLFLNFYFFIVSSLTFQEIVSLRTFLQNYLLYFILLNFFLCAVLFPFIWYFFEHFKFLVLKLSTLNIEYEPNLLAYLYSLALFIKMLNISLLLFFFFKEMCTRISLSLYLKIEKLFIIILFFIYIILISLLLDFLNPVVFSFCILFSIFLLKLYTPKTISFFNTLKKILIHYEIKKKC
jgi:hypothetical protein